MSWLRKLHRLKLDPKTYFSTKCEEKTVYVSKSTDIFTNLAVEDFIYNNSDFKNFNLLMLWQNEPCVVIGRHQNPWLECNCAQLTSEGVKLARRNSGGGTVYHDMGNLNLTFFTSRECYNRKTNLELISRALYKAFRLKVDISTREDLVVGDFKVSGTASKLGRTTAYHHCTLLVDVNKDRLRKALNSPLSDVETNATKSVKSRIINLTELKADLDVESVREAIASEYLSGTGRLQTIGCEEDTFPGLRKIRERLLSLEWRFLKTPDFKITRVVSSSPKLDVVLLVVKGVVAKVQIVREGSLNANEFSDVFSDLEDRTFSNDLLDEFDMLVKEWKNTDEILLTKNV
ncbi:lipoyltransferase 1, mitochondrial-like [Cylas formicarius]|uniref:lipoyltransferase 1, mitochondrial-like n=1 Tax=Cylas formicarius TaxID=197179 RepID=UPI0029585844|nr:lipoyltransferase 1, mitochondrial-like [Cylas formicarius]XP_060522035.1 lipoyltransferase 1, mitochondrial-like [Cylas formicarius]